MVLAKLVSKISRDIFSEIKKGNEYKIFINGRWVRSSGGKTFDVLNPSSGEVVGKAQAATQEEADRAVRVAAGAKKKIASLSNERRAEILNKAAELLEKNSSAFVEMLIAEAGKPLADAEKEVAASAERLRAGAEEALSLKEERLEGKEGPGRHAGKTALVVRVPVGVVLAITPFNYPLITPITKLAPAIAGGNAVVLKAASDDPLVALMLTQVLKKAGLPPGALNTITGSGAEIGDILVAHPKVDMISLTGNTETGKHAARVAGMKKLHLELGGKCPALVLEDADLDLAAKECAAGALKFSGQRCDALSRILVVKKVADAFVAKVVEEAQKYRLGRPSEKEVLGPLINKGALEKVTRLIEDAKAKGAKVLLGGEVDSSLGELFYKITVLDNVKRDMWIAWEETFGPVVAIIRVKDEKEALKLANESAYGLDASIFTKDPDKARALAAKLEDGAVHINAHPSHGIGDFPFGGDKDSGIGRQGVGTSVREMTKLHTVVLG